MTPKFRIYDKDTSSCLQQSSSRLLISSSGRLYDAIRFEWHEIETRYVVEMATDVFDLSGTLIYEGDVSESFFWGDEDPSIDFVVFDEDQFKLKLHDIYLSCAEQNKIIGTIHDEKYKGL